MPVTRYEQQPMTLNHKATDLVASIHNKFKFSHPLSPLPSPLPRRQRKVSFVSEPIHQTKKAAKGNVAASRGTPSGSRMDRMRR